MPPDILSQAPQKHGLTAQINRFMVLPQYVFLIGALILLSNMFSLELPVYTVMAVLSIYTCLWGDDLMPMLPILVYCYIAPSVNNNPGKNATSVFSGFAGMYILLLGVLITGACLFRIIRHRKTFFKTKRKLLPGMLLLSLSYLLGGIGSRGYGDNLGRNLVFAALQGVSVCLPYWLFSGGVDWKKARKDYFAWVGLTMGGVLFFQILWIYLTGDVIREGVIRRENIYTGWGIHNNLGGMLAMMIPFAFYLATKYRKGWLGTVIGSVFLLGTILSCSRNAMLTGSAIYFMSIVLTIYYAHNRKANTIAALVCVGIAAGAVILFNQQILRLFSNLAALGFDPNSRDSLYSQGMQLFLKYPVLGGSFFSEEFKSWTWATSEAFTGFFPPRWHNTFVQMLASCGVVGMIAYLVHRVQTFHLILHKHNKEKTFIACAVLALLICSLFDCHFFNIGPTLFYSAALAFGEKCNDNC